MILSVLLPAAVARAQEAAATQPDPEQEKRVMRQRAEEEAKALPTTRAAGPGELVQFRVEDNHLIIRTSAQPTGGDRVRVDVPGLSGIIMLQIRGERTDPAQPYLPEFMLLQQHDYTRPDAVVSITHVSINPAQVQVSRDTDFGDDLMSVQLLQSGQYLAEGDDIVRLYIHHSRQSNGQDLAKLTLSAPSVVELVRRFPSETSQYLEPIFNDFGQADVLFRVNPQTAWQVLAPGIAPPAELSAKVLALLKQLDAESPQQREAAAAELKTLGQPAAIVLMRQDRKGLTEEQKTQLDTFLAPFKPLPEDEAARMRDDPKFLLLCLGADDAQLRTLALERLKKVTNEPIAFDVSADAKARSEAIARLRAKLVPPTQPAVSSATTAPATLDRNTAAP